MNGHGRLISSYIFKLFNLYFQQKLQKKNVHHQSYNMQTPLDFSCNDLEPAPGDHMLENHILFRISLKDNTS